jgi:hypothetical protein
MHRCFHRAPKAAGKYIASDLAVSKLRSPARSGIRARARTLKSAQPQDLSKRQRAPWLRAERRDEVAPHRLRRRDSAAGHGRSQAEEVATALEAQPVHG